MPPDEEVPAYKYPVLIGHHSIPSSSWTAARTASQGGALGILIRPAGTQSAAAPTFSPLTSTLLTPFTLRATSWA
jgi:hypothetical protein